MCILLIHCSTLIGSIYFHESVLFLLRRLSDDSCLPLSFHRVVEYVILRLVNVYFKGTVPALKADMRLNFRR